MRCSTFRRRQIDAELTPLSADRESAARAHLATCAGCADWLAEEQRLLRDLAALRTELPFEIDVTARVCRTIAATPAPPSRDEPAPRQLGWAAAVASAAGTALLAALWAFRPDLARSVAEARTLFLALDGLVSSSIAVAGALLSAVVKSLGGLLVPLGSLLVELQRYQPLMIATVSLSSVMMVATIVLVVGRDIRRPRWIRGNHS